uniref:Candidate secreted effector n=1 Tax=Meloidogyne incognita TaxID=6306 RepID=A0A914LZ82_MELIC
MIRINYFLSRKSWCTWQSCFSFWSRQPSCSRQTITRFSFVIFTILKQIFILTCLLSFRSLRSRKSGRAFFSWQAFWPRRSGKSTISFRPWISGWAWSKTQLCWFTSEAYFRPGTPGNPSLPGKPGGPAGPTAPGIPSSPASPTIPGIPGEQIEHSPPRSPFIPGIPGRPGAPSRPSYPFGPGAPGKPGGPGIPFNESPVGFNSLLPRIPVNPISPFLPGAPSNPGRPSLPCSPGIAMPGVPK